MTDKMGVGRSRDGELDTSTSAERSSVPDEAINQETTDQQSVHEAPVRAKNTGRNGNRSRDASSKNASAVNQPLQSNEYISTVPTNNPFGILSSLNESSSNRDATPESLQSSPQEEQCTDEPSNKLESVTEATPCGASASPDITATSLSPESRRCMQQFCLRLACKSCYDSKTRKYNKHSDHRCYGQLLICQAESDSNGTEIWVVIRKIVNAKFKGNFKMCRNILDNKICDRDPETCYFCHSEEEKDIWSAEKMGHFNRKEIETHLRRTFDIKPRKQKPQTHVDSQGFQQKTKSRLIPSAANIQESNRESAKQRPPQRQKTSPLNIRGGDRDAHKMLMSKVGGHFLYLCEPCFDSAPPVMSEKMEKEEYCTNDKSRHGWNEVLVHVLSKEEQHRYLKIRQWPMNNRATASLCRHIGKHFGCWRGDACQFAHNEVEVDVWNHRISQDVIVHLCKETFIPKFQHQLKYTDGNRVVLFSEKYQTWREAQGRHPKLRPESVPVLCRYGLGCHRYMCTHPHTPEEVDLWTYMGENNLKTLDEVMAIFKKQADQPELLGPSSVQSQSQLLSRPEIKPYPCTHCNQHFSTTIQLQQHLQTLGHRSRVNTDKSGEWKYRDPPWNIVDGNYELCQIVEELGSCLFSDSCTKAHSKEELEEWQSRHKYRMAKSKTARDKKLYAYMGDLLTRHEADMNPFKDEVVEVSVKCSDELSQSLDVNPNTAVFKFTWTFIIKTEKCLEHVGLLFPDDNTNFCLSVNPNEEAKLQVCPGDELPAAGDEHTIHVVFESQMLGTFCQWVVFYFGSEEALVRRLEVDVGSGDAEDDAMPDALCIEPWTTANSNIVRFKDMSGQSSITKEEEEFNKKLLGLYTPPAMRSKDGHLQEKLSRDNYKSLMHRVLYIEEKECNRRISRFATVSNLKVTSRVELTPWSGTEYATRGHMFASINLQHALVDDSLSSQIVDKSVQNILLKFDSSKTVYEASILPNQTFGEEEGDTVYLKLSVECVLKQRLTHGDPREVTIQLQLDRTQFCYKHFAVDKLQNMDMVLPAVDQQRLIPCPSDRDDGAEGTNRRQEQIISFISSHGKEGSPTSGAVGPVLMCGPFGTGKTYTLAKAVQRTLKCRPSSKILICTHSNSAADLFITNYLDDEFLRDNSSLIRIYAAYRNPNSIDPRVNRYVPKDKDGGRIQIPSEAMIRQCQVVVTTLTTAVNLVVLENLRGFFSHILIDEAGQVLEAEALMPLALATKETCVVLTGDHIQMSPKIFSTTVCNAGLDKSLLERLFLSGGACHIFLTLNYRTCQPILDFISKSDYNQFKPLQAMVDQPLHPTFYPLMFYQVKGADQHNGKSYDNSHEAQEVVRRVQQLCQDWPPTWGRRDRNSIGVISDSFKQVQLIRYMLRRQRLDQVTVETVDNVQGKQFRVVIISTVRTCKTLQTTAKEMGSDREFCYGFLSDPKLLNTAFTRTQSQLVVVGDPIALCSVGRCSTKWKNYLRECESNNSLFPRDTTLEVIREGVRASHQQLNPNAAPFLPAHQQTKQTATKNPHRKKDLGEFDERSNTVPHQGRHNQDDLPDIQESNSEGLDHSDSDSWDVEDDSFGDIEDDILKELERQIKQDMELRLREASNEVTASLREPADDSIAKVHMARPDGEPADDSVAKVHVARPDGEPADDSIAKVHMARPDSEPADDSIAKVHMARPDGEPADDSIAKVHMARPDSEPADDSIAKVHTVRPFGEPADDSIAKVHMARPDGEPADDSIAKVQMARSVGEPADDSIAKVHKAIRSVGEPADDSIAKVHMARPDGEPADDSIAKVHMARPDGEPADDSVAKVHMARPDGEPADDSIAKVHMARPVGEPADDSIAKVHMSRPVAEPADDSIAKVHMSRPDGEPADDSIAKVHMSRPVGEPADDSIAKVHMARPDEESAKESIAVENLCDDRRRGGTPYRKQSVLALQQKKKKEKKNKQIRGDNLPQIMMKPGGDFSKDYVMTPAGNRILLKYNYDRSNLEGADYVGEKGADEECYQEEELKMMDEETCIEYLGHVESDPDKYKKCSFHFETSTFTFAVPKGENSSQKIWINGKKGRGQALHLDEVVVEMLENEDSDTSAEEKMYGKICCILKRSTNPYKMAIVCTLDKYTDNLMVPISHTFPKLFIFSRCNQNEDGTGKRQGRISADSTTISIYKKKRRGFEFDRNVKVSRKERVHKLFLVQYLKWEEKCRYPLCYVSEELPPGTTKDDGLKIIKLTHGIRDKSRANVMGSFNPDWSISHEELASRKDLRSEYVFTVDYPETQDIDDALSIEKEDDGQYRVGIHIADVAHFIQKDSELDEEAKDRAVTFYSAFSDDPIHMLPTELGTYRCSLLPDQDRLAISVFVSMDENGTLNKPVTFERSVICSKKRLTYKEVERMINSSSPRQEERHVVNKVCQLSHLAQKRRRQRLKDGCLAFSHSSEEEEVCHPLASSMVEEMMLIANEEVAKFLEDHYPGLTPLRSQLPPDEDKMSEWLDAHRDHIPNSMFLQSAPSLEGKDVPVSSSEDVCILKDTMKKLIDVIGSPDDESRKMSRVTDIICSDENHPALAVAFADFIHLQEKANYINSGDHQDGLKKAHHSLKKPSYTHFTSPIRRYFDIVVQRLLIAALSHPAAPSELAPGEGEPMYTAKDLSWICHHCTNQSIKGKKFQKATANLLYSLKLKEAPQTLPAIVTTSDSDTKADLSLLYQYRPFLPRALDKIALQHLSPSEHPVFSETDKKLNLTWKQRMYMYNVTSEPKQQAKGAVFSLDTEQSVMKISAANWNKLLKGIKEKDFPLCQNILIQADRGQSQLERDQKCQLQQPGTRGHPLPVKEISSEAIDEQGNHVISTEFTRDFKPSDVLQVQLYASMSLGLITPSIQVVSLTPKLGICVEHRASPIESFDAVASKRVVKCNSVKMYQDIWLPILDMMSIHHAFHTNESFSIDGIKINWSDTESTGGIRGWFTLSASFCEERFIKLSPGSDTSSRDKNSYSDDDKGKCDQDASLHYLCIRYTHLALPTESKTALQNLDLMTRKRQSELSSDLHREMMRVEHAAVTDVTKYKDTLTIHCKVKKQTSPFPKILVYSGDKFPCTVEVIAKQGQDRRLENAVRNLDDATPLIQNICLLRNARPHQVVNSSTEKDVVSFVAERTPFGQPNESQREALAMALDQEVTFIQGPPGTGKTVVGAILACKFADDNKKFSHCSSPPQVLYCGPSNESVNVVAGYLKDLNVKVVRVYSEMLEKQVFPVPGDFSPVGRNSGLRENKMDSSLDSIALHHLIRRTGNSHSKKINDLDQTFRSEGYRASASKIKEYRKVVSEAEKEELKKCQIILCTCNTSGSYRITANINAEQCIIDEAAMCSEPETLVPLVGNRPSKIVLIGDHKQLRPIITETTVQQLGVDISLFENQRKNAVMLTTQYRMHRSICKFPSTAFYGSSLQTAEAVLQRPTPPDAQTIWPCNGHFRNVFCHVSSKEETLTVSGKEGNEMSKANEREVDHVVRIATALVTKYNVDAESILVLSQYRLQCDKIRKKMATSSYLRKITVSTVIMSQGGERDYVILSTVRSLPRVEIEQEPTIGWMRHNLGFIMDENQMDVALTRSKEGLIIVGNQHLLQVQDKWSKLLVHYREHQAVMNARSFLRP